MGKIMVVSVADYEDKVLEWIQQYLLKNGFSMMNLKQEIVLNFPGLQINLETREIWRRYVKHI